MKDPFVKLVREGEESTIEQGVETTYNNHGDYYEFIALQGGHEIKRKRAESSPSDAESMKREYEQFKREVGVFEESGLDK